MLDNPRQQFNLCSFSRKEYQRRDWALRVTSVGMRFSLLNWREKPFAPQADV
jgi:hypothetical protein